MSKQTAKKKDTKLSSKSSASKKAEVKKQDSKNEFKSVEEKYERNLQIYQEFLKVKENKG